MFYGVHELFDQFYANHRKKLRRRVFSAKYLMFPQRLFVFENSQLLYLATAVYTRNCVLSFLVITSYILFYRLHLVCHRFELCLNYARGYWWSVGPSVSVWLSERTNLRHSGDNSWRNCFTKFQTSHKIQCPKINQDTKKGGRGWPLPTSFPNMVFDTSLETK